MKKSFAEGDHVFLEAPKSTGEIREALDAESCCSAFQDQDKSVSKHHNDVIHLLPVNLSTDSNGFVVKFKAFVKEKSKRRCLKISFFQRHMSGAIGPRVNVVRSEHEFS